METLTRTVLRYPLDDRSYDDGYGVALIEVPHEATEPKIVHVGVGTSPRVCAWVEVDDIRDQGPGHALTLLRLAFVPTGHAVPEGATYLAMVPEEGPTGFTLMHVYLLP